MQGEVEVVGMSAAKRSYLAMLLSMIPGLGQLYLRQPLKGVILFLGVLSACAVIYISSIPVNDWRDLLRLDGLETWWETRQAEIETQEDSGKSQLVATEAKVKQERDYHLYTFDDNLLFYIGLMFQKDLDNRNFSEKLRRTFKDNGILLSKDAVILTKKTNSRWIITHGNRAYVVRKIDGRLNIYAVKKLMYRPSWKVKISGFIQGITFWIYAIYDGWKGRRGFNRQLLKKKLKKAEQDTAKESEQIDDGTAKS